MKDRLHCFNRSPHNKGSIDRTKSLIILWLQKDVLTNPYSFNNQGLFVGLPDVVVEIISAIRGTNLFIAGQSIFTEG